MPLTMPEIVQECMDDTREAAAKHGIELSLLEHWPIAAMNAFCIACERIDELKETP